MLRFAFLLTAMFLTGPVLGQTSDVPEMPDSCSLHAENGFVRLVVCTDENATQETYVSAGKAACDLDLPCGAWIWTDATLPPAQAPDNHDGLTREQITSSKGIWVAERDAFIAIDEVD
ncbi:MAG: hypothetical protein AAF678_11860 [Pseudomonadota bacterium]